MKNRTGLIVTEAISHNQILACNAIRERVFCDEQNRPHMLEFGTVSIDNNSIHFLLFNQHNKPIGTARVTKSEKRNHFSIGRMAIVEEERSVGNGRFLLEEIMRLLSTQGAEKLILCADHNKQRSSVLFYEKLGFKRNGITHPNDPVPSIEMELDLLPTQEQR